MAKKDNGKALISIVGGILGKESSVRNNGKALISIEVDSDQMDLGS
jgi:hypothetical protein